MPEDPTSVGFGIVYSILHECPQLRSLSLTYPGERIPVSAWGKLFIALLSQHQLEQLSVHVPASQLKIEGSPLSMLLAHHRHPGAVRMVLSLHAHTIHFSAGSDPDNFSRWGPQQHANTGVWNNRRHPPGRAGHDARHRHSCGHHTAAGGAARLSAANVRRAPAVAVVGGRPGSAGGAAAGAVRRSLRWLTVAWSGLFLCTLLGYDVGAVFADTGHAGARARSQVHNGTEVRAVPMPTLGSAQLKDAGTTEQMRFLSDERQHGTATNDTVWSYVVDIISSDTS